MNALLSLLFIILTTNSIFAKENPCDDSKLIYKVCTDQENIFNQALSSAKELNRPLLIKFGSDACPWCRSLHTLLVDKKLLKDYQSKLTFIELAAYDSQWEKVESGQKVLTKLKKMSGQEDVKISGYPLLVLLAPNSVKGKHPALFIDTAPLEDNSQGKGHDLKKVKAAIDKGLKAILLH